MMDRLDAMEVDDARRPNLITEQIAFYWRAPCSVDDA
jgi:hypothetical protein